MDPDPLQITAPMPYTAEYYPLGFPLRLETNAGEILEAAAESWGCFSAAFAAPPIEVRVLVETGKAEAGEAPPEPPLFRAGRHLITITGGENFAVCDHERSFAFCRLNRAAAADRDFVRYYFLEAIALFILTQLQVTPVHAACIARGESGLLLCGDSGEGKSTLAYACARSGWTYISDNESWLWRGDSRTVLGNPTRIRMRERAVELFGELAGRPSVEFNGKRSIVLDTAGMRTAFACAPRRILFLERGAETGFEEMTAGEAVERLLDGIIIYSPPVREQHRESLARFCAQAPAARFRYRGLEDGLAALATLARE
jgi:hypothetical protein